MYKSTKTGMERRVLAQKPWQGCWWCKNRIFVAGFNLKWLGNFETMAAWSKKCKEEDGAKPHLKWISSWCPSNILVMGPSQNLLTWVWSAHIFDVWVGSVRVSHLLIWKICSKNLNFFSSAQKKSHRVGSKNTWVKGRSVPYLLRIKGVPGSVRALIHE